MYKLAVFAMYVLLMANHSSAQQKIVAECTVSFNISTTDSTMSKSSVASLKSSTQTVYIKGNNSRVDLVSPAFTQSVIYDKLNSTAFILREFGTNKFITKLNSNEWLQHNKRYDSAVFTAGTNRKRIAGYDCASATIKLTNGVAYLLYYTTAIVPSVKEYEYSFKDVPGFVLEYTTTDEKGRNITYSTVKINLSPVQQAKFDIPTNSGYRLLK